MITPVLIADDDEMVILMLKTLVKTSGLSSKPLTFLNGQELLGYLLSQKDWEQQCLILLDLNMPVMNGWEFLDSLEKHTFTSDIKVVIVTSSTNEIDKQKATSYNKVKGFIEKPVKLQDLENIKELLN